MKHWIPSMMIVACLLQTRLLPAQDLRHYPFEQVDSLLRTEARPLVIFIHTDWCRYCRQMDRTTFRDKMVVNKLNEEFYFLRLNGEEKGEINFRGHRFGHRPTGLNTGTHTLAEALGSIDGQLTYPTLCVLNPDYEIIFQYGGFLSAAAMEAVLDRIQKEE